MFIKAIIFHLCSILPFVSSSYVVTYAILSFPSFHLFLVYNTPYNITVHKHAHTNVHRNMDLCVCFRPYLTRSHHCIAYLLWWFVSLSKTVDVYTEHYIFYFSFSQTVNTCANTSIYRALECSKQQQQQQQKQQQHIHRFTQYHRSYIVVEKAHTVRERETFDWRDSRTLFVPSRWGIQSSTDITRIKLIALLEITERQSVLLLRAVHINSMFSLRYGYGIENIYFFSQWSFILQLLHSV